MGCASKRNFPTCQDEALSYPIYPKKSIRKSIPESSIPISHLERSEIDLIAALGIQDSIYVG